MAAILWSDVVDFAASQASVPVGAQTLILEYVNTSVDPTTFGGEDSTNLKLARVLLAAHLGTLRATEGNPNAITQETITATSLSTSFAFQSSSTALTSTSYGLEYKRLCRVAFARTRGMVIL